MSQTSQTTKYEDNSGSTQSTSKDKTHYIQNKEKYLNDAIQKLSNEASNREKKIQELENQFKDTLKEIRNEAQSDRGRLIEILGIFVAIFTFISVEIQILESVSGILRVSGFTLLLFSILILFLYLLYMITEKWITNLSVRRRKSDNNYWLLAVSVVFAILGIILVAFGDYNNPAEIKNTDEYRELIDRIEVVENEAKNKEDKIEDLEKKLNKFQE